MMNLKNFDNRDKKSDILAVIFILLLPVLYFADSLFSDTLIPDGDWYHLFYPIRSLANSQILQGHFPLWNPYEYMGSPLFASWQVAVLYPLNLLFLPLDPAVGMKWVSAINIMIAGLSMYLLTRRVAQLSPVSALVSSVLFMFGGFFSVHYEHINQVNVGVWIPLCLYCFHCACLNRNGQMVDWKKTFRYSPAGGIILAIQVFGGHPQILFYSLLLLSLYALFLILTIKSQNWKIVCGRIFVSGFIFILVGFGLSAIQWIPTRELSNLSLRTFNNYGFGTVDSLPPANLLTFFLPHALGFPGEKYWGEANFTEATGYMGILSIFLIVLSFYYYKKLSSSSPSRFFYLFMLIIAGTGLLLCLGKYDPLYPLAYHIIFPLQYFRCPSRMLLFMNFSMAILSGYGWSFLQDQLEKDTPRIYWLKPLFGITIVMLLTALIARPFVYENLVALKDLSRESSLAFFNDSVVLGVILISFFLILFLVTRKRIRYQLGLTILFLVILLDLFYFSKGLSFHWLIEKNQLENPNPTLLLLKSTPEPYRTFRILDEVSIADIRLRATLERQYRIQPDLNVLYHVADLMGYEEGLLPVSWYYYFLILNDTMRHQFYSATPNATLLGAMNVKYLMADKPIIGEGFTFIHQFENMAIFRNDHFLPLVYWVPHASVLQNDSTLFEEIIKPTFSPQSTVLLLHNSFDASGIFASSIPDAAFSDDSAYSPPQIDFHEISPTQIEINSNTSRNGFLVISIFHYPGWVCYIDKQKTPIYRANSICNAVYLSAGSHHISYLYEPKSFQIGKSISIITAILLILSLVGLSFIYFSHKN